MAEKAKGPASYFPSIEKTYGRPIDQWLDLIRQSPLERHMEIVNWLKSEYGAAVRGGPPPADARSHA